MTPRWVDVLRDASGHEGSMLRNVVGDDEVVLTRFNQLELLQGARDEQEWSLLVSYLDGQDYLEWQETDGTPGGLSDWQNNYPGPLTAATAVPEPSGLVVGTIAMLGALLRRQHTS